jgi:hypothetical protein
VHLHFVFVSVGIVLFLHFRAMAAQRTALDYLASKTDDRVYTCDLPAFVRRCLRFLGADIRLLLSQPIIDNETAIECLWIWIRESSQNGTWLSQDWSTVWGSFWDRICPKEKRGNQGPQWFQCVFLVGVPQLCKELSKP